MSLKSVNDILGILALETQREQQPFQQLLKYWPEVVGTKVALQTRPLSIQRDVLSVATASAAWAQNLTFQRQSLLLKLNTKLPQPLVNIRFSTAEWKRSPLLIPQEQTLSPQDHPSYLGENMFMSPVKNSRESANIAFENWARMKQERSQYLSLCPQCQCPTPAGELQHWGVCSPCRAKLINQGIADS
ncbi:DciA family protein [Okeanomitos corallinicola TIOX110]|uniref:DciA family protein n=1 Tax=Okeanomitos corallinicola TIOX110 TaxID=3133117 RepID=A0ABZ2UP16_9CYAN